MIAATTNIEMAQRMAMTTVLTKLNCNTAMKCAFNIAFLANNCDVSDASRFACDGGGNIINFDCEDCGLNGFIATQIGQLSYLTKLYVIFFLFDLI